MRRPNLTVETNALATRVILDGTRTTGVEYARDGRVHGPAGFRFWQVYGISAGQAGVLAMVMMAGAMRVAVSFAVACAKDDGDLDLRARCRSRPTTFRYFPISLVTAW